MKTFLISTVSALAFAGAAMAQDFSEADADESGGISLEELQDIDPNVTEAEFTLYDTDLSGELDEDQYEEWRIAIQGAERSVPEFEPEDDAEDGEADDGENDSEESDDADEPVDEAEEPAEDPSLSQDDWEDEESEDQDEESDETDEEDENPYEDPSEDPSEDPTR